MSTEAYITALDEPRGWRYGSQLAIYTERLVDGRLMCASYVDNGVPVSTAQEMRWLPAFDLVIDGEALAYGWQEIGFTSGADERGLPIATLTLRHERLPVDLQVITRAGGHGFFMRTLAITNTSPDRALGLTAVTPLRGALWGMADNLADNLRDATVAPYTLGRFRDIDWGYEGTFEWNDLPLNTEVSYGSGRGRSGHGHPFAILRNNIYGGYFLCSLAWSANWRITAETIKHTGDVVLQFSAQPTALPPMRVIAPGETVTAPEVHFGLCHDDFDGTIQRWHAYLRGAVLRRSHEGLQPVILNHWGYMEHEMDEERLKAEIDLAHEVGAELFMVDAGWFGNRGTPWWSTTGNWQAGDRLPNDLFPVFRYAHDKGMKCGLWVEIESAGDDSRLAQEHPDWFITRYGQKIDRVLDLAKPVVRDYVHSEIIRIIERYKLDMFRLDYNLDAWEGGFNPVAGRMENTLWRHVEAIYAIFDDVAKRYPDLQLENCSSGGGRTDLGIVSRFTTTWTSDWMRMPRTVRILNGLSMALPPEYLDRLFGSAMEGASRGDVDAQLHVILLAHPTLSGLTPALAQANPALMAKVKHAVRLYKDFIRPLHHESRVFHHTPVIPGADGSGWCALELAAPHGRRAVAGVFRLVNAAEDTFRLRFRGLDTRLHFRVTVEPDGHGMLLPGAALAQDGLLIRLDTALTSKLILVEVEE